VPDFLLSPAGLNFWLPLLVAAVLEGIAIYTWHFRQEPGACSLVWGQLCKMVWVLALLPVDRSSGVASTVWNLDVRGTASLMLLFFWFRFVAEMSGYDRELPSWVTHLLGGVTFTLWLAIVTNPWHGWMWKSISMEGDTVRILDGPFRWVLKLAGYAIGLVIVGLSIAWAARATGLRRRQARLILLASVISWVGLIVTFLPGVTPLAILPLSFLLSSAIMAWAFHRWRVWGLVPLAQEVVVKTMIDGLMVVDDSGTIVALNPIAHEIFPEPAVAVGSSFKAVTAAWPALAGFVNETDVSAMEAARDVRGNPCCFHVTVSRLHAPLGQRLGRVLVFKDVTVERQQQARILEQQQALSILTERQRLGRELHDGPGQIWSFLSMQLQSARALLAKRDFALAEQRLDRLAEVVRETHFGLRESITGLQTGVSDGQGLLEALEAQLQWYREQCDLGAELAVGCDWRPDMLSPGVEAQALRIVQEALTNVRKWALASRVRIVVEREGGTLELRVEDNGRGVDTEKLSRESGHHGLRIMRERAAEIGARLKMESAPGQGTRVRLFVPIVARQDKPAGSL
jgi:signal transduction histidine kinase